MHVFESLLMDCYPDGVRGKRTEGRFAAEVVHGVDDAGAAETIVIWIDRKQGAMGRGQPSTRRTVASD